MIQISIILYVYISQHAYNHRQTEHAIHSLTWNIFIRIYFTRPDRMFAKLFIAVTLLVLVVAAQDKTHDDDMYERMTPKWSRNYEDSWSMVSACSTNGVHALMVLIPAFIAWIMIK